MNLAKNFAGAPAAWYKTNTANTRGLNGRIINPTRFHPAVTTQALNDMLNRCSFPKNTWLAAGSFALGWLPLKGHCHRLQWLAVMVMAVGWTCQTMWAGDSSRAFFAMDTGTQDATHHTPAEQVALAREIGFAGVGPTFSTLENLQQWLVALDASGLKLFALYLPLRLDDVAASVATISQVAPVLHGHDTLLWIYVSDKNSEPSGTNHDAIAICALGEIAAAARAAGLKVALYPHAGMYVQRVEDAVRLVQATGGTNVGVTFNLCHWLKVDGKNLGATLTSAQPYLRCVTLNGADAGGSNWQELIQPLDRGSYDVTQVLRWLDKLNYTGPVGLQQYGIGGSAAENLKHSMEGWRKISAAASSPGQ